MKNHCFIYFSQHYLIFKFLNWGKLLYIFLDISIFLNLEWFQRFRTVNLVYEVDKLLVLRKICFKKWIYYLILSIFFSVFFYIEYIFQSLGLPCKRTHRWRNKEYEKRNRKLKLKKLEQRTKKQILVVCGTNLYSMLTTLITWIERICRIFFCIVFIDALFWY